MICQESTSFSQLTCKVMMRGSNHLIGGGGYEGGLQAVITPVVVMLPAGSLGLSLVTEVRMVHINEVTAHAAHPLCSWQYAQQSCQMATGKGVPPIVGPS